MIRREVEILDALHGGRTCLLFVSEEPSLDVLPFVADAGGDGNRVSHELHGNGAK